MKVGMGTLVRASARHSCRKNLKFQHGPRKWSHRLPKWWPSCCTKLHRMVHWVCRQARNHNTIRNSMRNMFPLLQKGVQLAFHIQEHIPKLRAIVAQVLLLRRWLFFHQARNHHNFGSFLQMGSSDPKNTSGPACIQRLQLPWFLGKPTSTRPSG